MVWFICIVVAVIAVGGVVALMIWAEKKGSALFDNPPRFTVED